MSAVLAFVLRFGPVVASFVLGLSVFLPAEFKPVAAGLVTFLGLFGVQPNAEFLSGLGLAINGAIALIGVVRKLWSIAKSI